MRLPLVLLLAITLLVRWLPAIAAGPVRLPDGETLVQMEWSRDGRLLFLTESQQGWALRIADREASDLAVVNTPRSFAALKSDARLLLSPAGNGVAALVPSTVATEPGRLWLYRLQGTTLDEVNLRKLDRGYYPAQLAWRADGSALFVGQAPYLGADIDHSVVEISMQDGDVRGAVLKGNLDLVSQLAYSAGRDALVVKCAGLRGEYPAEPLIALAKPGSSQIEVLHAEAQELVIEALPDGTVFLSSPRSARERWILLPGEQRLRRSQPRLPMIEWTASADGNWLGGIVDGKAIGRQPGERFAVLQSKADGRTVFTREPYSLLRFAPDSQAFAASSPDGTAVSVFPIPASSAE